MFHVARLNGISSTFIRVLVFQPYPIRRAVGGGGVYSFFSGMTFLMLRSTALCEKERQSISHHLKLSGSRHFLVPPRRIQRRNHQICESKYIKLFQRNVELT